MNRVSDQNYLLNDQYKDSSNFSARFQLHERFSVNPLGWFPWVLDQIRLPAVARVLELGCGPGRLWQKNARRIPPGWDVMLTDFSPGMLEEAKKNLHDSGHPFRFEVADAQEIPFEDGAFDGVIANHMLYHVPDRAKALSEIRRVLKPGGMFYAATVGDGHLREMTDLAKRFNPDWNPWGWQVGASFLLENGAKQIERWFSGVVLHRYEDALVVTEAEPLVAYILSSGTKSMAVGDQQETFTRFVEAELARGGGAIRIAKVSGLFEAHRA